MLLFIEDTQDRFFLLSKFQYISCYSLSQRDRSTIPHVHTFQYISCYSLSLHHYLLQFYVKRFNTSHVTLYRGKIINQIRSTIVSIHLMLLFIRCKGIYFFTERSFQYISCYSLSCEFLSRVRLASVSIHLMLLFISIPSIRTTVMPSFQYISCYSLS